jgi:tellurite methyltransferase
MRTKNDGGYEAGYAACDCFWGLEPGSYVRLLVNTVRDFSGLRVLDAGCGEGKNSAFLAENGSTVVGVEISERALIHAKKLYAHAKIMWLCGDVRNVTWPNQYFDIVVAYGLFHCMSSREEIESLHDQLSAATKIGGYHVVCTFNDRDHDLCAHPMFRPCLLSHDEYLRLYEGWLIEVQSDETLYETHPHNMFPHAFRFIWPGRTVCWLQF